MSRFTVLLMATALLTGQRGLPHSTAFADPATDVIRSRVFLSITSTAADLTVDGAVLANALFTLRSNDPSVRMKMDGNTVHVTANTAGTTADVQIDTILAHVAPHQIVGWTLSLGSSGTADLQIQNLNRALPVAVDRFETSGPLARFTSSGDLLRDGGPLGVSSATTHLLLAFFYPWYDPTSWSSPELADHPAQQYSTDDPVDMARIMTQAKGAGLDALAVSWQG